MLSNLRLLIVEDVFLIALDIQRVTEGAQAGQTVMVRDFAEAASLAGSFAEFDLAIVNPPGPADLAIASRLASAGPAIVVSTGTPGALLPPVFAGAPLLPKPFSDEELLEACRRALAGKAVRTLGS